MPIESEEVPRASLPMPLLDERITLNDGRVLSYAEFGDPSGHPVIAFHGFPGCRLELWPHHPLLYHLGVRLITPDRPGAGNSTPQPERRLLDYPTDIIQLADHLQLGKVGLLGISGGAPYAVACAYALPAERISMVGLMAPAAPEVIDGHGPEGLRTASKVGAWAVRHIPWAISVLLWIVIRVVRWGLKEGRVLRMIDKKLVQVSIEKESKAKPVRYPGLMMIWYV